LLPVGEAHFSFLACQIRTPGDLYAARLREGQSACLQAGAGVFHLAPSCACEAEDEQARSKHGEDFRLRHGSGKSARKQQVGLRRGMKVIPEQMLSRIAARYEPANAPQA
jgi:hypothetical protein